MKINPKLLAWLLGGLVAVSGLVFGIHRFQSQRIARALLFQANRAEEQGETLRLVRYLQRYLELRPDDLEEKARLAQVLTTDFPGVTVRSRLTALSLLDQVLARRPDRTDLRLLLIKTGLDVTRTRSAGLRLAREHLNAIWSEGPENLPSGQRGELESSWGLLAQIEGDLPRAREWYRQAIQHNPQEQSSFVRLAALLRSQAEADPNQRTRNQAEADALVDQMVEKNPQSAEAHLARWNYRRQFDLILVEPVRPPTALGGATQRRVRVKGTTIDPSTDVTRALDEPGASATETATALLAAADLQRMLQNKKEARKSLERGLAELDRETKTPDAVSLRPQFLWHLIGVLLDGLFDEDKTPETRNNEGLEIVQRIHQLRRYSGHEPAADFLEGRLRLAERRWSEAVALLERARLHFSKQSDQRHLLLQIDLHLGQCFEQLEEPGAMFTAYQRVAEADPENPVALLGMANALWQRGRPDEAAASCRKAMKLGQIPASGWKDIARLEIQRQLQRDPAQRNWTEAEQALQLAGGEPGASATGVNSADTARGHDVTLLRAELFGAQHKFQQADEMLQKALEAVQGKDPKREADLWAARSWLMLRWKQPDRALALLEEGEKAVGRTIEIQLARVAALAELGMKNVTAEGTESAEKKPGESSSALSAVKSSSSGITRQLRELEAGVSGLKQGDQARLLDALAEAYFRLGNQAEGRRLCEALLRHPDHQSDLRLRLLLFDLALQQGDEAGMTRALEEIRSVERIEGPFCHQGQALRLVWLARSGKMAVPEAVKEAQIHLSQVAQARPDWAKLHLARAQVQELLGQTDEMIKELKQAVSKGESSPAVIGRLVSALCDKGCWEEADEEAHRLSSSLLIQSELGRLAASTALQKGDPARALELARSAVAADSRDYRDHLWLSRVFQAANNPQQAEARLRQAISLAPTEPAPYLTLIRFLADRKQLDQARLVLQAMNAKVDPKRRAFAEALGQQALGQWKAAQAAYQQALDAEPGNFAIRRAYVHLLLLTRQLGLAEKLLRELVASEASGGREPPVEGRKPSGPSDKPEGLRTAASERDWARQTLAVVLADGTDYHRFQEALTLVGVRLDAAGYPIRDKEGPVNPDRIRAQARVLATQRQRQFRERALELFEQLSRTQNLKTEDQFVAALLQESSGNWTEARKQLLAIAVRPGPLPQYLVILARGLIREKDYDEAQRWIAQLEKLEKEREVTPGTFATVELRARLLEARGQGQQALELLQQHSQRPGASPEEMLLLVQSLTNQRRYNEAFQLLDRVWQLCRPELAGAASVSLLRQTQPTDEQVRQIETRLRQAIAAHPQRMVFRLQLADLCDVRGRYPEAIEQLRIIVQPDHEPGNSVALNNLAWLLAHQNDGAPLAKDCIDRAIQGLGKRAELLDTRGIVWLALGQTDQAIQDLKEVNHDAPTPSRLFHLARAYQQARDKGNALKILRKAQDLGLDPDRLHPVEQQLAQRMLTELKD